MNPHNPRFTTARRSAYERGYNRRWRRASRSYLRNHPQCAHCPCAATVVDHVKPHKGDYDLFWQESNWQPLCKPCHDTKTATHDGGFGRPVHHVDARYTLDPLTPEEEERCEQARRILRDPATSDALYYDTVMHGFPNPQLEVS